MAKQTMQERLVEALKNKGCKDVTKQFRTAKYLVFSRPDDGQFYFVGKSGALRVGKTVSDSFGCADTYKNFILKKYGPKN